MGLDVKRDLTPVAFHVLHIQGYQSLTSQRAQNDYKNKLIQV